MDLSEIEGLPTFAAVVSAVEERRRKAKQRHLAIHTRLQQIEALHLPIASAMLCALRFIGPLSARELKEVIYDAHLDTVITRLGVAGHRIEKLEIEGETRYRLVR